MKNCISLKRYKGDLLQNDSIISVIIKLNLTEINILKNKEKGLK